MNDTLKFYYDNAESFTANTLNADMSDARNKFLKYVKSRKILDLGCGAGRDTLAFSNAGYEVTAMDGCKSLCEQVKKISNAKVLNMTFDAINFVNEFDGIWACASLLHVSSSEIIAILEKVIKSAKYNSPIYMSFKYGEFEGMRNGRFFNDYTEDKFKSLIKNLNLSIAEMWLTEDVRPDRSNKWLNTICIVKQGSNINFELKHNCLTPCNN